MSAASPILKTTMLEDKLLLLINESEIGLDEIESIIQDEFEKEINNQSINLLTDLRHLICFIKTKKFSNPFLALHVYLDKETTPNSKKALVSAMSVTPDQEDQTYELICYLAQHNKLEPFTQWIVVPPFKLLRENGQHDEHKEWYLLFELFSLCKATPPSLFHAMKQWIIKTNPWLSDLNAMHNLLIEVSDTIILMPEYFLKVTAYFHSDLMIEKITSLIKVLQKLDLLRSDVLEVVLPLIPHAHLIETFVTIFRSELQSQDAFLILSTQLPLYCQLAKPSAGCYDDKIDTNTSLHQSVIEQNIKNLSIALTFTNKALLLFKSYKNTALLLACKLANKSAAHLILARMRELECDVNQADGQGMTALHWANFYRFDDLIAELLAAGANPHLNSTDGKSCYYFYHHQFTMKDFRRTPGEIIEGTFKLSNPSITDICYHMDKIALNLKLVTPEQLLEVYRSTPLAQIRSSCRFQLFFLAFRDKLVTWLNQPEVRYSLDVTAHIIAST